MSDKAVGDHVIASGRREEIAGWRPTGHKRINARTTDRKTADAIAVRRRAKVRHARRPGLSEIGMSAQSAARFPVSPAALVPFARVSFILHPRIQQTIGNVHHQVQHQ